LYGLKEFWRYYLYGKIAFIEGIFIDITEEKQAENIVKEKNLPKQQIS
jgi:hypothetical protein